MWVRNIADLARPFSIYALSLGIVVALETVVILKLSLTEAAALFTPVCLMLGGMYGAKSYEEANKTKHEQAATVGVAQAQASTTNASNP